MVTFQEWAVTRLTHSVVSSRVNWLVMLWILPTKPSTVLQRLCSTSVSYNVVIKEHTWTLFSSHTDTVPSSRQLLLPSQGWLLTLQSGTASNPICKKYQGVSRPLVISSGPNALEAMKHVRHGAAPGTCMMFYVHRASQPPKLNTWNSSGRWALFKNRIYANLNKKVVYLLVLLAHIPENKLKYWSSYLS